MSLPTHPLFSLVDCNANGLKSMLMSYIDATVDKQSASLKNSILEMINNGQICPQCSENVLAYQTTFPTGQSSIEPTNSSILYHFNDQLITHQQITLPSSSLVSTITTSLPLIKQKFLDTSSTTIPINVNCIDAPNDDDSDQSNNVENSSSIDEFDAEKDFNEDSEINQICSQISEVNAFDLAQPSPSNHQVDPFNTSIAPSTMNNQNKHLSTHQITSPPTYTAHPITTSPVIKQEFLEDSSTTIQINVDSKDAPNGDDNDQSIHVSSLKQSQNEQVPIDDLKEEYDDDEDEGEYMSDCDECEDCVKGICQLNQSHLIRENVTNKDAETGVDTETELDDCENENPSNASMESVQMNMPDVIDDSIQSAHNAMDADRAQKVDTLDQVESPHPESYQPSTSSFNPNHHQQESNVDVKSDKRIRLRKSEIESSKEVKRIKLTNSDEIQQDEDDEEQETVIHQVVTLEVNCTEPGCKRILKSSKMWKQHLLSRHGQIAYKQLKDNVRLNQHGQTYHACTDCQIVCKSQHSLLQHWKRHHQAGKFECSVCGFVANLSYEVRNHHAKFHLEKKFECTLEGCNKAFRTKHDLEQHARDHNGERPFKCAWDNCELTFKVRSHAIRHVRTRHFHLPRLIKEQQEQNIIDTRDPQMFVQTVQINV